MKKLLLLCLLLLCLSGLAGCDDFIVRDSGAGSSAAAGEPGPVGLPGGLHPVLLVNGTHYRWTGMSREYHLRDGYEVYTVADTTTFLPEGYTPAGELSGITEAEPARELELKAGFEASGTVYTSPATPEAVYVLMTTDWFENYYIRFVSDDLHDNESLFYQGREYRISPDGELCERVEALPEACVSVGALRFIGTDLLPARDLETNCIADSYSHTLDGREVRADPAAPDVLYVYEHQYWAQGDEPGWIVCRLWTA